MDMNVIDLLIESEGFEKTEFMLKNCYDSSIEVLKAETKVFRRLLSSLKIQMAYDQAYKVVERCREADDALVDLRHVYALDWSENNNLKARELYDQLTKKRDKLFNKKMFYRGFMDKTYQILQHSIR